MRVAYGVVFLVLMPSLVSFALVGSGAPARSGHESDRLPSRARLDGALAACSLACSAGLSAIGPSSAIRLQGWRKRQRRWRRLLAIRSLVTWQFLTDVVYWVGWNVHKGCSALLRYFFASVVTLQTRFVGFMRNFVTDMSSMFR